MQTQQQQVSIKLADGTNTDKHIGTVQMHIAKTVNCKKPTLVTFFILDGPNSLLSRHTMESLWPDVYRMLIKGTGCDKGAQKNSCDAKKSQVQTLTVNQGKPEVNESSEVITDKVVKQTQLVKKSDMTEPSK